MMTPQALRYKRMAIAAWFMAQGLIFASWASRIPDVKAALHLGDGQLGTLLFAIPIGEAFSIIPAGMIIAKLGSKTTAIACLLAYALTLAMIPMAQGFPSLFAILFCLGFVVNSLGISVNTQAVFLEKQYGKSIMSSFHGCWSLGGLLGGIIGAGFAAFLPGLPWHFTAILLITLAIIIWGHKHLVPGRESADKGETENFNIKNVDGYLWILGIICFASMFCEGITYDWSAVYFDTVVQVDDSLIRLGYVAGLGAVTVGRFITDRYVTRYGAPRVLLVCGALLLLGFTLIVALPYLITATIGYICVGLGISSVCPLCNDMAGKHPTLKTSTAITLVSSIGFIGFLLAPPVIGWGSEVLGLRLTTLIGALAGILILILVSRIPREE